MSTETHSHLPWQAEPREPRVHGLVQINNGQVTIGGAFTEQDAAFIVRASNAHAQLVAALRAARANSSEMHADVCSQIDAALAAATGETA